jgi:6-phosphogluconolactonase
MKIKTIRFLIPYLLCVYGMLNAPILSFGQNANLVLGTYSKKGSKGIYLYNFDTTTGKAVLLSNTDSSVNPSFLTLSKDRQFVYAVGEVDEGKVSVYAVKNNQLVLLQQRVTKSANPCYVTLSPDQRTLFVANYTGGSITSYHRFADGLLSNPQQFIQHQGSSIIKERQDKAHVHSTIFSPDGKYLLTPDLGMDEVAIYPFNANASPSLNVEKASIIKSTPGSGPRHLAFSKNGKYLYIVEEISGTVTVYNYSKGKAVFLQKVLLHAADYKGIPGSADIHLSPDGLYLYASNRGTENNIAKLNILPNGKLVSNSIQYFSTQGEKPRNFNITADGKWLLVGNQDSDTIVIFKRNLSNGDLIPTGNTISVSMPVCIQFF